MAPAPKKSPVTFVQCVGSAFFFLQITSVRADGKLFAIGPRNGSWSLDLAMAQQSCAAIGAHLASAEELKKAIRDCSFAVCTRGWLADGTIGTTVCNRTGSKPQSVKVTDVQIEKDPSPSGRYDALCVKVQDETEGHIDYEDNFPDDLSVPAEDHNAKEKGMEHEPEKATDDSNKTLFADGDNHIGVKTMYNEQGTKVIYEGEDFPIGPVIVNNDTKAAKSTDSNTDDPWLDGYPVTEEAVEEGNDEEGDKTDGSMGMEEDANTDQPNYAGVRKASDSNLEKDFLQLGAVPPLTHDDEIKGILITLMPTSAPENVSVSKGSDDVIRYVPTTPMEFVTQELPSVTTVTSLNLATLETSTMFYLVDHIPLPEEEEMTTMQTVTTDSSQNGFTPVDESYERGTLTYELGGKLFTTFEPCIGINCSTSNKGPMIAIGVTVVCLLLLVAFLAVWCFKKQHQKTSVYKLNGKDHARHQLQQIEMQKV
ncbi:sushi domain-containing protein 5 isoform X3 [Hemicordylus capensis]|uniref:sushi domain-containing protein 5 isoform X3 n=1 Tax=Hemicordylus capensis TaxID=884348 RepID=UPI002303B0A9|nr:sushi domain-containing protein 5 isoform X3 [Hemicordylus capensis]